MNGWFGDYDKLTMAKRFFAEVFQVDLDSHKESVVFSGDSPNDAPVFSYFPNGVGVANVLHLIDMLPSKPTSVTKKEGGDTVLPRWLMCC